MEQRIPYKKIFRLAFITAPLFGLFGATPALVMGNVDITRIPIGFLLITLITFVFWLINIGLLRAGENLALLKNNMVRYLASALCTGAFVALIFLLLISKIIGSPELSENLPAGVRPQMILAAPLIQSQSINVIIIVLMEMALLRDKKLLVEKENNQLRVANLEARHGQLKQQLHPHFLFNSLNILRSLIKRSPNEAETYLEKLSELLRFSISNDRETLVPLQTELELSTHYLEMQRVRFGNALLFNIHIPVSMSVHGKLPVYSIQLLVENAIKHNVLTQAKPLHITVTGNEAAETITVSNNSQPKTTKEPSNGVGLANLTERYQLLGNSNILISKVDNEFSVTIKVLENENRNY
jgi:two-component system, LytTR family, sensor kinase